MKTYIALLRGVNVSGSNLLKMEELRTSMISLGFKSVKTYIQSGNIVFSFRNIPTQDLEKIISQKILMDFSLTVNVLVKTKEELQIAVNDNPFLEEKFTPIDILHLTFLSKLPDPLFLGSILPLQDGIVEGKVISDRIYLKCPLGYSKTKFTNVYFEKKLKLTTTTRNWKTIMKLCEMSSATP